MDSDIRNWVAGFDREGLLAYISLLYYGEGLRQSEIATRMGVSRATIVNYLREAREAGIVDVRIRGSALTSSGLSRKLCEMFGLRDAYVAYLSPQDRNGTDAETHSLAATGRIGAIALLDMLKPGDNVGVAWGVTVKTLADQLPMISMADVTVWQMVGSMDTNRLPAAETCAIQIARRLGAACHTLHAPAILSSVELAEALRAEPAIRRQLARLND
ncbi:MAG: sugar-binding domain-containing protein, partial [Pseudomonadota bacterium]